MITSSRKFSSGILSFFIFYLIWGSGLPAAQAGQYDIQVDFTFDSTADPSKQVVGYRLYQQGNPACDSSSYDLQSMTCVITSDPGTYNFTMSARYSDQTESPQSTPFPFTINEDTRVIPLVAQMTASSQQGETPFTTTFNSSGSTGIITGYSWNFGDGGTASGPTAEHTYQSPGTYTATLTIHNTEGESSQSSLTITATAPAVPEPPPAPPVAVISSSTAMGEAPLAVQFDGSNSSDPDSQTLSYSWDFGDGRKSEGIQVSHTYTEPGTHQATLSVTDETGLSSQAAMSIVINAPPPAPPVAVISSSTAMGEAPLAVQFDGSNSSDPDSQTLSYSWDFGDGRKSEGIQVSHTYTEPGTYQATLSVTDETGLSSQAATPIVINAPPPPVNEPPTAVLTLSELQGNAPLTVTFSADGSSDPDGSIAEYLWSFGDGATATGISAEHSYTEADDYTVTLQVTDNGGETGSAATVITVLAEDESLFLYELGELEIDHEWLQVKFTQQFTNPAVVCGPPTINGSDPVTVRVRNLTQDGFEVRIQEWDYLDGTHNPEVISFFAMEQGTYTLPDGTMIEAGTFTGASSYQTFALQQPQGSTPVILTQIVSEDMKNAVTGRVRKVDSTQFQYKLQEQEKTKNFHDLETVSYIAWQQGSGMLASDLYYESAATPDSITHKWYDLEFQKQFTEPPLFLADMQSCDGGDSSIVRAQNITGTSIQINIEEEQSKDSEVRHTTETTGYIVFGFPSN